MNTIRVSARQKAGLRLLAVSLVLAVLALYSAIAIAAVTVPLAAGSIGASSRTFPSGGTDAAADSVEWHFVLNGLGKNSAPGSVTVVFESAGSITATAYKVAGGTQHFSVTTSGHDVLVGGSANVEAGSADGLRLVLSDVHVTETTPSYPPPAQDTGTGGGGQETPGSPGAPGTPGAGAGTPGSGTAGGGSSGESSLIATVTVMLHEPHVGASSETFDSGGCDDEASWVVWHFVLNGLEQDSTPGRITIVFEDAGTRTVDAYKVAGGTQHFNITTAGHDVIVSGFAEVQASSADGLKLLLSNVCVTNAPPPPPPPDDDDDDGSDDDTSTPPPPPPDDDDDDDGDDEEPFLPYTGGDLLTLLSVGFAAAGLGMTLRAKSADGDEADDETGPGA